MSEIAVSDENVRTALTNDQGTQATLVSWTAEDFTSKFDGATSIIKNIRIKYLQAEKDQEVCYVAKLNPDRGTQANYFYNLIFVKECNFYSKIIPALNSVMKDIGEKPLPFPKCVHYSLEEGNEMIFLENLRESNYKMENKGVGLDEAHATLVLQELGRLHAASFLLQAKLPHDLFSEFPFLKTEWTKEFNLGCDWPTFMQRCLDVQTEMFEKIGGCEEVISWIKKVKPQVGQIYDKQLERTSPFATIIHGDCWINNMLFRYDEGKTPVELRFLDLQGCRYASVALDLQHFLNLNVVGEVRRPRLTSLLTTYHTSLAQVMKVAGSSAPFTFDQIHQEYIDKGFYGAMYGILWIPNMVKQPEDASDILDQGEDRQNAERNLVLRMVDNNPLLKPKILSIVDEWIEHGVIS